VSDFEEFRNYPESYHQPLQQRSGALIDMTELRTVTGLLNSNCRHRCPISCACMTLTSVYIASSISSSNRASLFSVRSGFSQATTLSNQSQPPPLPANPPQYEIWPAPQFYLQPQPPSLQELAEPVNQDSPISTNKSSATEYICVACNKLCKSKSSLSRHQTQHCEREKEWFCLLCGPRKRYYRKDKLTQHHINNHGRGCVAGCKQQQGGLCKEHLSHSTVAAWPKKAWGCPCCVQCFDTLAAWTTHSATHPIRNGSVEGWSLSTMVQSLLGQPYIKEAVAELPWQICDLAKVDADRCRALREVLERRQLSKAVHDHYDFRHLQLPEKLAHYAFRMLANGEVFPDDVSNVARGTGTGEAELFCNGRQGQMFAPVFNVAGSTPFSYCGPEDPSPYDENAHQSVETGHVHESQDAQLLSNACGALFKTKGFGATEPVLGYSLHPCGQVLQTSSDISPNNQTSSLASVGIPGNALQEPSYSENVHHNLSMQKSLQNPVHLPPSVNSAAFNTKPLPLVPAPTDGTRRSRSTDRHGRRHSKSLSRSRERRRDDYYGFENGPHHRDQTPIPALPNTMTLEFSITPAAVDHNTDSARTASQEAESISPQLPRLSVLMSDIRSDDWLLWEPDKPDNP
jgi:hypothetical protein